MNKLTRDQVIYSYDFEITDDNIIVVYDDDNNILGQVHVFEIFNDNDFTLIDNKEKASIIDEMATIANDQVTICKLNGYYYLIGRQAYHEYNTVEYKENPITPICKYRL